MCIAVVNNSCGILDDAAIAAAATWPLFILTAATPPLLTRLTISHPGLGSDRIQTGSPNVTLYQRVDYSCWHLRTGVARNFFRELQMRRKIRRCILVQENFGVWGVL